jgi:very-short-patch-repair endonuclease
MEFAKRGINALHAIVTVDSNAEFGSPFEETVYEALTAGGLHLQKQVGVSGYRIDLGVVDPDRPGRFLLGIECDGATYHSFKTARDRDRLRQQVLEGLGWKIHRIWSRDWIENRQGEIKKVLSAVRAAQSGHTIT